MSYASGEALILTRLQTLSNFNDNNTSRGKWAVLNSGNSSVYGILREGMSEHPQGTGKHFFEKHKTIIEVWQRYKDDGTTRTDLQARVEEVKAEFYARRLLGSANSTIQDSKPARTGEPAEMWKEGGNGPAWMMQEVTIEWTEEVSVTFAE